MKRKIFVFAIFLAILALCVRAPLLAFFVKKELRQIFPDSVVSIDSHLTFPFTKISLSNIEVKRLPFYRIKIDKAELNLAPLALLRGQVSELKLENMFCSLDLKEGPLVSALSFLKLGVPGNVVLKTFELKNLQVNLKARDFHAAGVFSFKINLPEKIIYAIKGEVDAIESAGILMKNMSLEVSENIAEGKLFVEKFAYGRVEVSELSGSLSLAGDSLGVGSLSGRILGGRLGGEAHLKLEDVPSYQTRLVMEGLDLSSFVDTFKINEKIDLAGALSGQLIVEGEGLEVTRLDGGFAVDDAGGTLTIKDMQFLKNIAQQQGENLDMIVDSFKDYRYDEGALNLFLKDDELHMEVNLNGLEGQRNVNIILHNFKRRRQ